MPEQNGDRRIFTLSQVAGSIQKTLSDRFSSGFWVKAEMNRLHHYPQSGHCYPELVEKTDNRIVAQMSATLWKDDYQRINSKFLAVLREPLKDGISILLFARVTYHPVHGLSLWILDIDPSYSLGELEKEKRATIDKLKKEGIFDVNRSLELPMLPKRIAVISVRTSKGYADFMQVIDGNDWGYCIFQMLFPSLLQGENAVEAIIGQLNRIRKVKHHFDAVALIRGGGGDVGLSCYNNYLLAREIALFPIPVLTGIGHSTNETVTEMVSHTNAITPTDLADFLIQTFHNFSVPLQKAREEIIDHTRTRLKESRGELVNAGNFLKKDVLHSLSRHTFLVEQVLPRLEKASGRFIHDRRLKLDTKKAILAEDSAAMIRHSSQALAVLEKQVELTDPARVLKRGYSITLHNGKAVTNPGEIHEGDVLQTILAGGEVTSTVKSVQQTRET